MKDRIIKFLTHENITATKFADEIGVQRSSISHILSGRNNPSFEFIQKILSRYKSLNADWLILGSGPMFKKMEQGNLFATNEISTQPDLFRQPAEKIISPGPDKNFQPLPLPEILPSRRIDKILVFYTDKTFEEYMPQNNT